MIQFPVIRRLEIKNYELFKNENSSGIAHDFPRGVHAVVGINGLGKTTLLNILYRALLGPYDQSKSDDAGLLGSQHKLSDWRNKDFFRARVKDGANKATVEIDVSFGKSLVTVRRTLANLKIEHLAIDGEASTTKGSKELDQEYQDEVVKFSGVANYFDFFAVLRYLVFFLEDRVELIWDKRSQFDMLRVLLFDTNSARETSEAYDEAQVADSRFRNRRAILGKDKDRLADAERALGDTQSAQFRGLQAAIAQAEERDRSQVKNIEAAREKLEDARLRREKALLDLQEARTALEYEEQAHYKQLFPDLAETAQHVFLNLLSGGGCLVCGNKSSDAAEFLREKLAKHHCPVCDSTPEKQENVTVPADFSRARLRKLKTKVDGWREAVVAAASDIDAAEFEYEQLDDRREEDRAQLRRLRAEMSALGYVDLPSEDEIELLKAAVEQGEKELENLRVNRVDAENRYGRLVKKQGKIIDETVGTIRKRFSHYAGLVLAERCELNNDKEKRSIGMEGRKFEFPYFEVMMTSGVFDQSLSVRDGKEAVSESQGEFLDLAFRLALIDAVTGKSGDSMMVVETPESSLDSLFVAMAGDAFRSYGENAARNNVFIASTNLNNEEMLSALLGVTKPPRAEKALKSDVVIRKKAKPQVPAPVVPAKDREKRIINLLDLAAPNAALREHRKYYAELFSKALAKRGRS